MEDIGRNPMTAPYNLQVTTEQPEEQHASGLHIWLHRIVVILYIVVSLQIGLILLRVPWKGAWTENTLLSAYPHLHHWMNTHFVRGVVSGLGLLNLWIGVREAILLLRG